MGCMQNVIVILSLLGAAGVVFAHWGGAISRGHVGNGGGGGAGPSGRSMSTVSEAESAQQSHAGTVVEPCAMIMSLSNANRAGDQG